MIVTTAYGNISRKQSECIWNTVPDLE